MVDLEDTGLAGNPFGRRMWRLMERTTLAFCNFGVHTALVILDGTFAEAEIKFLLCTSHKNSACHDSQARHLNC